MANTNRNVDPRFEPGVSQRRFPHLHCGDPWAPPVVLAGQCPTLYATEWPDASVVVKAPTSRSDTCAACGRPLLIEDVALKVNPLELETEQREDPEDPGQRAAYVHLRCAASAMRHVIMANDEQTTDADYRSAFDELQRRRSEGGA